MRMVTQYCNCINQLGQQMTIVEQINPMSDSSYDRVEATHKKQERLSYISPPSTFVAHKTSRTWYISLTSRVSYRIHCQCVILITYQYDEDVVFAGKAIHPSIHLSGCFFLLCYFLQIAIKNMMRALLLQKEVIRPSIHPIIRRMQRLPKKQLSFQINANQCIFSSICKFRFCN